MNIYEEIAYSIPGVNHGRFSACNGRDLYVCNYDADDKLQRKAALKLLARKLDNLNIPLSSLIRQYRIA